MSQFDQIETFILVVDNNSFAEAAKKLDISAAAVSKQISHLEERLGVQLLQRTTRKLKLTDVGAAYYEQSKRILSEMREAESLLMTMQKEPAGTLRISSSLYFGESIIVPYIHEFMALYPKVELDIQLAERFPDFERENIDILFGIVTMNTQVPENLVRRRIHDWRYVLCASPEYLKKNGTPKVPEDILKHRYITHTGRRPDNVLIFKDKIIEIQPVLRLNYSRAMLTCALNNIGIVKIPDFMVEPYIAKKQLVELLPKYHSDKVTVYLYYQRRRHVQPKIRRFIDFIMERVEKCEKERYWLAGK